MKSHRQIHVYLLFSLCLAAPACQQSKEEVGNLKEETPDDFWWPLINYLDSGGRVYVGTIETVRATQRKKVGFGVPEESGKFTVRVQRAVRGPAVKELNLRYVFDDFESAPGASLSGDDTTPEPWGTRRPPVGENVLLVLTLDPDCEKRDKNRLAEQNWERDAVVAHVWIGVGPDHPLVKDMALAVQYLEMHESKARRACFLQLCNSAWPSIRGFALGAAFGSTYGWSHYPKHKEGDEDWSPESRLMVEYVKTAGPLLTDWERMNLTGKMLSSLYHPDYGPRPFAAWVSRHANDAAAEWLSAYEDWYLSELGSDAMRPEPERSKRTLIELRVMIHHYGISDTLAFFQKRGRAGLEERLEVCTRSPDRSLATNAKLWLNILRQGIKIAEGTITNSEGDRVSLQTIVFPQESTILADTIYRAENLPPGVRIDTDTGVISGQLKEGAAKKSPYKVSIFYRPRKRDNDNPGQEKCKAFTWHVRPRG